MIALLKAIRKHDSSKSQLQTFSWPIIRNELITAYNKLYKKSSELISNEPSYEEVSIIDLLPKMSEEEQQVVDLKIEGFSIKEVAETLNKKQSEIKSILEKIYMRIKANND